MLVGAVLGPQQAEHRQLDVVRLAAQLLDDQLVLGVGEAELAVLCGAGGHAATSAGPRNSRSPSVEPVSSSTACSGCGIRPSTLPASFVTPAMSRTDPFGVVAGGVAEGDLPVGLEPIEHLLRCVVATFAVLGRNREALVGLDPVEERRVRLARDQIDLPADEAQLDVPQQRPRQQPRLAEHLEAVADPQHRRPARGHLRHRLHRRGEAGDRAGPQVVAVGEAAGDDDRRRRPSRSRLSCQTSRASPDQRAGVQGVPLVAGPRELKHPPDHRVWIS